MKHFKPLLEHELFHSTNSHFGRISFMNNSMFLNLIIPKDALASLEWYVGKNSGLAEYSSRHIDHFPLIPSEFQDIIKQACSLLEKRDRIRNLF